MQTLSAPRTTTGLAATWQKIAGRLPPFVHSLRLRLVAAFLFVALLVASLMTILGMALVHTYANQREESELALYAEMARAQVLPLMSAEQPDPAGLQAAVERVARVGGVRVRVLAPGGEALADSGQVASLSELQALAEEMAGRGDVRVQVLDEDGNLLAESGQADETVVLSVEPAATPDQAEAGPARLMEGESPLAIVVQAARSGAVKVLPVESGGQILGMVEISEGPPLAGSAMDSAQRAFTIAGSAAVLAALLVGLLASARLSRPLQQLAGVVEQMQGGDLSVRAAPAGQDEVGRLADQFNRMAGRLEASFNQLKAERDTLRRFVSDASHELRTPITALQLFIELLQDAADDDPQERARLLADSQAEVARLAWITNNLLDLSRMEAGIAALNLETCRAADLLSAAGAALKLRAEEKGIALRVLPPAPGLVLSADRPRLEMALTNLLDNAVKYTPPGGTVCAGAEALPGEIRFWVEDTGPGIPPEDLPHIFDRFYRGKNRDVPGSGLGLAIVKSIAELHGGSVEVESEVGRGTRVVVRVTLSEHEQCGARCSSSASPSH